ncbi:MAG: glycosyltransferase [Bacteroidetes bacterium]|nr:glycosyltransferase [Bacteroidota bacterium]
MKKVLFITYYWPPSGKASLHWPLKMIKYLPQFGWQPVVLTVDEDTFSSKDESLLNQIDPNLKVYKSKTFEPFNLYKKFIGKKKDEQLIASETISTTNKSLTHRISIWIRMNLFIPDARIGWYFSGVKTGREILGKEKIDAIVTIGPPHSVHLIGLTLAKKNHKSFFPVFIDPWVDIVYYRNFKRSKITLAIDNYLEKKVIEKSTASIFVTETMKSDYVKRYPAAEKKSFVLYWGYNEEDFENLETTQKQNEETILHAGNIFDFQNIPAFWKRIRTEIDHGRKLKLKFIGTVSPVIKQSIKEAGLSDYTEYVSLLPYRQMLQELMKASYLLVCATEPRHVPGKLFEYLRTGKPIIAFGNNNKEVKKILEETNAGMMFGYDEDGGKIFESSIQFFTDLKKVKHFDRKNITKSLSKILSFKY